ncbi:hypothetical protein HUU05_05715 [candidate division KSB1 bacterium]|nr:hypothetical protein [candidate division KSB1 bacterium]
MDHLRKLLEIYRNRGLLLDANLLLLYVVGRCDIRAVTSFKRTKVFTPEDYDLLENFVRYFSNIVATPNILTEVSNFLNQLPDNIKVEHFLEFADIIRSLNEKYVASAVLAIQPQFEKFGLTDFSIIAEARGKYLVLTDDFRLSNYLQSLQVDAINFNHIRTYNWKMPTR